MLRRQFMRLVVIVFGGLFWAWTQPKTWSSEPLLSTDLNVHVRDNLDALKDPPSGEYTLNEGGDYTTTSTSFVDIDATNLSITIDTNGGDVFVMFVPSVAASGQVVFFELLVDGSPHAGDDGICRGIPAGVGYVIPIIAIVTGLSAASHTFKLQWKVSSGTATLFAGAGTSNGDVHPTFIVREMS